MASERLYRSDVYVRNTKTYIINTIDVNGFDGIVCDKSPFFPEGGGQPSDTGIISSPRGIYQITHAQDENLEADVIHISDAPFGTFKPGDEVELKIDWKNRKKNMERHSGEHILSGAFYELFGANNKGFHIGEEYITIDLDNGNTLLTKEQISLAEKRANQTIRDNLPISTTWFDSAKEASVMPVRKPITAGGKISVVTIGTKDDIRDCVACCGTHPAYTGEIGIIKIYKTETNKGMTRVYFDCGSAAFKRISYEMDILSKITNKYSTGADDILSKLEKESEKEKELRASLAKLSEYYKKSEMESIISEIKREPLIKSYFFDTDMIDANDLLKMGHNLIKECPHVFFVLFHKPSHTVFLFSEGKYNCSALIKEHAAAFGGKGGGKPNNARAVFQTYHDAVGFIKTIKESISQSDVF